MLRVARLRQKNKHEAALEEEQINGDREGRSKSCRVIIAPLVTSRTLPIVEISRNSSASAHQSTFVHSCCSGKLASYRLADRFAVAQQGAGCGTLKLLLTVTQITG